MLRGTGAVIHMHYRIPAFIAVLAIPHRDVSPPKWDQLVSFRLDNINRDSLGELGQVPAVNTTGKVSVNKPLFTSEGVFLAAKKRKTYVNSKLSRQKGESTSAPLGAFVRVLVRALR